MPYLKKKDRDQVALTGPNTAGELNYSFTLLAKEYWNQGAKTYARLNDILGALEGAKLEFYRRIVVDFEEQKRQNNGDVYSTTPAHNKI